jgi:aerobic-type carbon monoxide dehydrogenase small subunit (CoxS/CutS family)
MTDASKRGESEVRVKVTVNGTQENHKVPTRLLLSDFIRDTVGLTGTHLGCEHGVCGACTIMVDGAAVRSCSLLAVQVDGSDIRTVEGLAGDGELTPMQEAFHENHAMQCGFCTAGFLMTLESVKNEDYSDHDELLDLLSGNLCRCTGYQDIVNAVTSVWGDGKAPA